MIDGHITPRTLTSLSHITPHHTKRRGTIPCWSVVTHISLTHHGAAAAAPHSHAPPPPGHCVLDGDGVGAHGRRRPGGRGGDDAAVVPGHGGRVHGGGVLGRGRRRRHGHGRREQAPRAAGRVRVHRLRRAAEGQRAVLQPRGVLLQLPARRRGQPVLARVQRHHPVQELMRGLDR
jgi:hypothetical protein